MKRALIAVVLITGALLQNITIATAGTSVTLYAVADNYPDSKYPKSCYGTRPVLYVGNSYDREQNIWGYERIYVRFDLSELPKNQLIVRATLRLWQYYAPETNQTYEAHRVLVSWDEATQDWTNQPPWAPVKTSETVAPARAEVAVEWDITNDVKAWYSGEAHNYGTVIKTATEKHEPNASSGFWSREYPVDAWKPVLIVVLHSPSEYAVTIMLAGLPSANASQITVDGKFFKSTFPGEDLDIFLTQKTVHNITVSKLVPGQSGVRYVCDMNQIQVSAPMTHVFAYSAEYLVNVLTEPTEMFKAPTAGWYRSGAHLSFNRTGPDQISVGSGARLVFNGWYLNGKKLAVEPTAMIVDEPMTIEGRYGTEYYLNVTSSVGKTEGSGWYAKDSVAMFSIDSTSVDANGLLGLLGVRRGFAGWVGSSNLTSSSTDPQSHIEMKAPASIEAVWKDEWSPLYGGVPLLLVLAVIGVAAIVRWRYRPASGVQQQCGAIRGVAKRLVEERRGLDLVRPVASPID